MRTYTFDFLLSYWQIFALLSHSKLWIKFYEDERHGGCCKLFLNVHFKLSVLSMFYSLIFLTSGSSTPSNPGFGKSFFKNRSDNNLFYVKIYHKVKHFKQWILLLPPIVHGKKKIPTRRWPKFIFWINVNVSVLVLEDPSHQRHQSLLPPPQSAALKIGKLYQYRCINQLNHLTKISGSKRLL